MKYFFLIVISLLATGFSWWRIFSQPYAPIVKVACLILTLAPIAGPVFYLMIDPPESSPVGITPEEFWTPTKGAGRVWPSFGPLKESLRAIFNRAPKDGG